MCVSVDPRDRDRVSAGHPRMHRARTSQRANGHRATGRARVNAPHRSGAVSSGAAACERGAAGLAWRSGRSRTAPRDRLPNIIRLLDGGRDPFVARASRLVGRTVAAPYPRKRRGGVLLQEVVAPFGDYLQPRELKAYGIREIPLPSRLQPELHRIDVRDVERVVRAVGGGRDQLRDILALKAMRRFRVFRPAVGSSIGPRAPRTRS